MDLSPSDLRLLVAVEHTGSFTAAGREVGLSQSAVSHAVRECERRVGAVLFERGRRGASPTPAGERALVHARQILRQLELLRTEARDAAAGSVTGTVRIAAFRTAAAHLLPPALDRLTTRFPGLKPQVLVVPELGRGAAGEVADGRADLAIATLDDHAELPGLHHGDLLTEPYLLVHPAGHPRPRTLPLLDWPENCSSYTRTWWRTQDWLPSRRLDVADDSVVLSMVAQGIGIAVLPRLTVIGPPPGVELVDLGPDRPTRRLVHVTTSAARHSLAVRELIRELRASAH
ncbi:LysR family transcriptional regulator [Lentzea sp. BCCO 10_0061]|uniref:LysR family transcriptional regulator n=1 Tax=Lentzea sokolovensis TaxID=3095429 RepID=A0ABU4UQV6_9PSEU|nr:LysR family transcriptional regulator [Lentzea sp. BCCO 10_0061]MDX8141881.1 LysR family transcriptional regulator [Lentzea sp. BCCO 10_0061]